MPNARGVQLYLDGAHTRESLAVASAWYHATAPPDPEERVLVFYCKQNRDPHALLASIVKSGVRFGHVIFSTEALHAKAGQASNVAWQQTLAHTWRELGGTGSMRVTATLSETLALLPELRQRRPLHVFITGSLYLVGGTLKLVSWEW